MTTNIKEDEATSMTMVSLKKNKIKNDGSVKEKATSERKHAVKAL